MSYKLFIKDLNDFYKKNANSGIHYEIAQKHVRDIWLKNNRYDDLIDFILENWDSGNCDDFIEPLEDKLLLENKITEFNKLWRRILYYRLTKMISALDFCKKQFISIEVSELIKINVSDFNMYSVDSYNDPIRVLAFSRHFLLQGIEKYKKGLIRLKATDDLNSLMEMQQGVSNLDKTNLKIKSWC